MYNNKMYHYHSTIYKRTCVRYHIYVLSIKNSPDNRVYGFVQYAT